MINLVVVLRDIDSYYKYGERFFNPYNKSNNRNPWYILLWKLGFYRGEYKSLKPPLDFSYPIDFAVREKRDTAVYWVNHSTFYIKAWNKGFLTDPVWSGCCSPFSRVGPKRKHHPGLPIDDLSSIDVVLISHNHYDHLDKKTVLALHALYPHIHWIVPSGVKKWFFKNKIFSVSELYWWESFSIDLKEGVVATVTAVPAQHFSGRFLFDVNKTLWCGYVVEIHKKKEKKSFYFTGDTGYNQFDFKKIGQEFGGIDLSMIPIGAYAPRNFMKPIHINPNEAVKIHQDTQSKFSIGMHWKTFRLSEEPINQPPYDLFCEMKKANLNPSDFVVVEPGKHAHW